MVMISRQPVIAVIVFCLYFATGSGLNFWLDREYVYEGDDFNMTCSSNLSGQPCSIRIYYPEKYPEPAVGGCTVDDAYKGYVRATCLDNDTHRITSMQILNGTFLRDDGEFSCICGDTAPLHVDIRVNASVESWPSSSNDATCTTSCGYPANITWYEVDLGGVDQELTHGEYNATKCYGETKLNTVQSIITFGNQVDLVKCCVDNAGKYDNSSCKIINITSEDTTIPTTTDSASFAMHVGVLTMVGIAYLCFILASGLI